MYDKAPRIIGHISCSTNENVGPGSYNISRSPLCGESYAPFLSLKRRDTDNDESSLFPAPGQYNIAIKQHIIGGSCMKNKSVRFKDKYSNSPAPGAYDSEILFRKAEVKRPIFDSIKIISENRVPKAPSIPLKLQSYGYEEDENGILVRQPVPEKDTTIGPAYYDPDYNFYYSSTKGYTFYKGSERKLFNINLTPGPGAYNTEKIVKSKPQNLNANKEISKRTFVRKEKSLTPPLDYDSLNEEKRRKSTSKIHNKVPFGIQSERFVYKENSNPAPCEYQSISERLPLFTQETKVPFGSTAARFTRQARLNDPLYCPGESGVKKKIFKNAPNVGFNMTSVRFKGKQGDDLETPGPAEYFENPVLKSKNKSSTFASKSERFIRKQENEDVGPGSYNTSKEVRKICKAIYGFNCSDNRFDSKFIKIMARLPYSDFPSPDTYFIKDTTIKGNMWTSDSLRFCDISKSVQVTPGPGTYDVM